MKHLKLLLLISPLLLAAAGEDALVSRISELPHAQHAPAETDAEYGARMSTIVKANREVSARVSFPLGSRKLLAAALAVWYRETRFALDVHRGEPGHYGSDGGRAKCLGQIHINGNLTQEQWEALAGTDLAATERCAMATMRALARKARGCNTSDIGEVYDAYGTGNCESRLPKRRREAFVELYRKMLNWKEL